MNNNWDPSEDPIDVVVQENPQLEQYTARAEQNHPHHSRTTPEWNNQSVPMQCESSDDRNNDSGISPGHYDTSPSPDRRSSGNGAFSPSSSTSQESMNSLPSCSYSPEPNYRHEAAPVDAAASSDESEPHEIRPINLDRLREEAKIEAMKRAKPTRGRRESYKCPICEYITSQFEMFWGHLGTHYNPARLESEPPIPTRLSIRGCTREQVEERIATAIRSSSFPVFNAQSSVKLITCKVCKFVAITKVEFWRHTQHHMKPEKRNYCRYCPFVTDLRHHYDYHMNKEIGAKPFVCKQCSYDCVNKSMLSSHMKSHSTIRQFTCRDCGYLTKYCHSLKMHLRKSLHTPGPALNPDGTVNEYITIDVYGTRRGPKASTIMAAQSGKLPKSTQARKKRNQTKSQQNNAEIIAPASASPQEHLPQTSQPNQQQPMMMDPKTTENPFSGSGLNSALAMQYHQFFLNNLTQYGPYNNFNGPAPMNVDQIGANILAHFMMMSQRLQASVAANNPQNIPPQYNSYGDIPNSVMDLSVQYSPQPDYAAQNSYEVLDLSASASPTTYRANNNGNSNNTVSNNQISDTTVNLYPVQNQLSTSTSRKMSGTSRRKGRAKKLNRVKVENEIDEGNHSEGTVTTGPRTPDSSTSGGTSTDMVFNVPEIDNMPMYACSFCSITFGNEAMYTIHMGFHGYSDPFTCNSCGHKSNDALSFNIHLSRVGHT